MAAYQTEAVPMIYLKKNNAFTLVEIALVLVIIGLIIGGILTGGTLIRIAEARKLMSDIQQYHIAINTFRSKYKAIPGDMPNAEDIFEDTYNGNNNGRIDGSGSAYYGGITSMVFDAVENLTAWQQLGLADLVSRVYSIDGTSVVTGVNIPQTGFGAGVSFMNAPWIATPYQFIVGTGTPDNDQFAYERQNFISPAEAFSVDKKMDDGNPVTGKVRGTSYQDNTCSAPDGTMTATGYIFNASYVGQDGCALLFIP